MFATTDISATTFLIFLVMVLSSYGAFAKQCYDPLGLGDGRIKDTDITATSVKDNNTNLYGPGNARLKRYGGYRAEPTSSNTRALEVHFHQDMIITGIATQGYFGDRVQEWTKKYLLGYKVGASSFFFKKAGNAEILLGNQDSSSIVFHNVSQPALVNSVLVFPSEWQNNFAIRLELYGCIADGNECLSSPCQNNGSCWDKIRGYECNCTAGFNGSNCEINIDDCASSPCHHGGNCTDLATDFSCVCMPGYTGKSCDGEIDECNSSPCHHNGTCVDLFNDYHCNCTAGYNGTNCELDIDECSSSPCLNNATCLDHVNGYNCTCAAGFTGKQCKTDVDECLSNPCQHAGTCTDQVNGYMCSCPVGFGGLRCEKDTAFFLIAWFKLKNLTFTYSLLNESSALYQSTEKAVVNEVDAMLRLEDKHFFGSALSRFSPSGTDSVIAEVLLRTLQNSTDHIATVIKQKMKVHTGIFEAESNYKSYENRAFPGCKPPNITLPLSKNVLQATKMKKSEDFTFRISAQIHCPVWGQPGSVQALYTIALYSVNRTSGTILKVTTSIGTLVDDIDWTIRAIHLSYGVYYFKLTTDIERQTGTTVSNFGYIEVTSTALVVGIMGKTEASRGLNQTLTLDASRSHDPDVGPGNYAGLTFTWLCKRKNEKFPDDITSLPVVTPHSGSSSLLIQGGCYGTGVGRLKSRPGLPFLVDLDVENMEGDQDYVVKLVLTKRGQSVSAVHSVRINDEIRLSIKCIQNCQPRVTLSTRLILETTCTGLMCKNIDSYVWSMEYRNKSEPTWHEITNLDDIVLTLANSPNFVTKEAKLFANASYIVTVNGTTSGGHSSIVSYTFVTNQPPMGGSCTVDKTEGKAWQTDFIFTCSGWHDEDLPLIYKFRYNSTDGIMMVFQTGPRSTAMGKLPVGNENHDYDLHVQVRVCDALESSADVWIIIKVTDPDVNTENLLEAVSDNGKMNEYLKNNDIELAAQRATAVLSVVNHAEAEEVKIADRIKIKDSIVDSWASVNISELEEVSQVSAVVASAANKRNELSIKSQEKAVGILDSMTIFMSSQVKNKTYYDNEELVEHVGTSLLNGMGNLLDITAHEAREQDDSEEDAPFIATKDRKEKSRSYSQKILNLVNQVGSNVEYTKELHEKPSVLRTQSISMLIDRQVPSRIGDKTLEDQGTKVTLPSVQELIGSGGENQESLSTQLVTFKTNPFTWDESARDIESSVLEFELKDALGNPLNVSNLTQEVELFIPPLKSPEVIEPEKFFVKPSDNGTMRFHKIDIPGPEYAVSIRIVPIGGKNLSVFVRYAKRPTLEEYNFTAAVPDYSSCNFTEEYGYSNCSTDPFVVTISAAITGHTGLHYVAVMYKGPGGKRKESNSTKPNTQARVRRDCSSHSGRQKRSCVGVKDPPTTPPPIRIINPSFNASTDVNYTMSVTIATCLYWKAIANKWTTEGCRVGSKSRPEALQCLCTHLSSFGGNFLVAPNPIDFDYVFTQFPNIFESGNVVVLATVLSIFGLYIIGLVIARRADRKDERKAVENLRLKVEGEHLYEVSVYTGMWKGCGTSANVAMVVYGEDSRSETLHLFDSYSDKRLFARASINNFLISLPDTLHSPVKIKLWHDNSGTNPSWYVNQVVVRDTEADGKWYFLCNRWLAVDKEDGEVEVNVPLASKKDLSSFKYQFYTRVTRNLGDGHIWLSVVTRPPHSPFTRAQRLSCCICVLLCAMLAGAMFYQFGKKQEDTVNFGPLRFSLRQLVIGVQSALVVVPLNLLIVTIFRNVKTPSNKRKSQKQDDEETGRGNGNVANLKPAKKAKTPGCLPHFFVYVGWVLCILASLAAGTFIVFYSVQWGKEVSNQWLTSALISFVQDIAVMQPIKVILIAVVLALILKKPPEEKTAQSVKDADLEVNKNVVVVAPKGDELVKARKHRESVVETISTLVEMVFFLLFSICLFIVVYGNRGYNRYRLTAILENVFQESFEEIDSSDAFWAWVEEEFVPGVYDTSWYNDQRFIGPEGYISTREAFLVGMPKFRQVRVKEEYPCEVATSYSPLKGMFKRCIPVYSPHVEDTTRYNLPGWIPVTNMSLYDSVYDLSRLCPKPWRYNTSGELDTLSSQGRHASYDGGGYVADLGYNSRTAMNVIRSLKHNNWIDEKTAVVFVEFTVFQPSSSLFSVGKFIYEVLPTGKPETRTRIDTLSIYPSPDPGLRSFFVACQIVLVLLIAYFLLVEAVRIYRQGCSYFRSFWNWMNLLQLLSAITTVAFFFFKEKYVSSYVKHVQANPFETASPDYVIFWSELELIVLSIIVFIVTVKFLRIIRFNRHICQMISSLKLASTAIASYSVLFFIDLVSFSLLGVLVFGNELEQYHSFLESLSSLFQKFLGGDLHFYELQAVNRVLGPLFVFAYMLSMGFILINMFVAILNDSYESVKELLGGKFADAELGVFIKEYYLARLQRLHDIVKRKLGNLGYRHKLYDRPRTESKVKRREDYLGSFLSLPSDYPPFVELRDRVDCSSQLNLLDNEETYGETETSSETNLGFVPVHEEAVELTLDEPDADSAPSVDCNSVSSSSNADILDLFGELPESMVDDDETIDNVRKDLAEVGAVLRLSKRSYRRFSSTGDKYVVQTAMQMGPSVAITFRPRRESDTPK